MPRVLFIMTALAITACGCEQEQKKEPSEVSEERSQNMIISVSSSAFPEGGTIPAKYTCDGGNKEPGTHR
jgi:phosphatidylethanolamine-binding protein (PEBP) family uncharacterized protein